MQKNTEISLHASPGSENINKDVHLFRNVLNVRENWPTLKRMEFTKLTRHFITVEWSFLFFFTNHIFETGTVNWGNLGNRGNLSKKGMPSLTNLVSHTKYF